MTKSEIIKSVNDKRARKLKHKRNELLGAIVALLICVLLICTRPADVPHVFVYLLYGNMAIFLLSAFLSTRYLLTNKIAEDFPYPKF